MSHNPRIAIITSRFENLKRQEQLKLQQAFEIMSPHARDIIALLPLLLHLNHPLIPGYRQGLVPHGIDGFVPNEQQLKFVKLVSDNSDFSFEVTAHDIMALYAMGSTSSIGQGFSSDFDIWVCVKNNLSAEQIKLLQDKCNFLSVFARSQGVELTLFVTAENRFTEGFHGAMDGDNCGSAQNLFLLDEFYRTAIRLSGRYLIWYLISSQEEKEDYNFFKREIANSGILQPDQWFDFGSVVNSLPAEYFGSGLWLLYKGIESPFKAMIKILLMEVYANEYPHTSLLSSELKDRLHNSELGQLILDPYFAMFKKVSDYLIDLKDYKRLDLMRMSFYLKIFRGLKGLNNSHLLNYRLGLLQRFAKSFNFDSRRIHALEACDRWKIGFIRDLNTKLLNSLIESYRSLLRFSIRHGIEYAITSDDACILSRRLYAAYDRYPGKILVFNEELSASLEEKNLTYIFPHEQSLCRKSWHLYPCAKDDVAIITLPLAYNSNSVCEAIAWALFNKLQSPRTHIDVVGNTGLVTGDKIKALSRDIMRLLHTRYLKAKDSDMQKPRTINHCLIILNFEDDPTADENKFISTDFEIGNTLSSGRQKHCLVGSIDLLTVNNWGELISIALPRGEDGVLELLAMLARFTAVQNLADLQNIISVVSHAQNYKEIIRFDLESLIKKIFECRLHDQELSFEVGRNVYHATNHLERGIKIMRINAFGHEEYDVSILSRFGMRTEFALQVPAIVDRYATMGIIQYFFAPNEHTWDIYILNERNEVNIQKRYEGSRAKLVNSINRFYSKLAEEKTQGRVHFNLPQYFVISEDEQEIHPFTIKQ